MRDILEDAEGAAERGDIGPGKSNRERDAQKFPKRFYKEVSIKGEDDLFVITLDDRPVKTPGKQVLGLPNEAAAQLVANEWEAVEKEINPLKMPTTRLVNTAIDGVTNEMQAVMEDIIRYSTSDLLCYRANAPEGLVEKQREHWDPLLDWCSDAFGARFETAEGIMHVEQSKEAVAAFSSRLKVHEDGFKLAAIHTFTSISGSALIALALADRHISLEDAWSAAHVDEDWNVSLWGEDWEAKERREQRWVDFSAAHAFYETL